jgi:phosphinothricin acetyltransferase
LIEVVDATAEHLDAAEEIYAEAAENTPATFDLEGHGRAWWERTLAEVDPVKGNELIVAIEDGVVLGWAKSGPFRDKAAYESTRETTTYVDRAHRGKGIGDALYSELLARLDRSGLRLATGGVTQPNEASNALHRKHGFTEVGTFHGVGEKLGQAWDVLWFERPLAGARELP